jgi:hypothetical protein
MVHEGDQLSRTPEWGVEWNLVQILDDDVVVVLRQMPTVVPLGDEWVGMAGTDPMRFDAIEIGATRGVCPAAAQQIDAVASRRDPTEDFLKVKLRAACLRVGDVLPVENEYAH